MTVTRLPAKPWAYHKGRFVSWELYRHSWYITIDLPGGVEVQINRWGRGDE